MNVLVVSLYVALLSRFTTGRFLCARFCVSASSLALSALVSFASSLSSALFCVLICFSSALSWLAAILAALASPCSLACRSCSCAVLLCVLSVSLLFLIALSCFVLSTMSKHFRQKQLFIVAAYSTESVRNGFKQ